MATGRYALSTSTPRIIEQAWGEYDTRGRVIAMVDELSPHVSTNRVYRLHLSDGVSVIAKLSSYGSYVHFRQDHQLVEECVSLLRGGRFDSLLARVLQRDGRVFSHRGHITVEGPGGGQDVDAWVVFYREAEMRESLARVQSDPEIVAFAQEMARLHRACDEIRTELRPSWKSLGSDIANLYDALGSASWRAERNIEARQEAPLKWHCDRFLDEAERLGYHRMHRIPVLVDWNIGNFSVEREGGSFRLLSRWDYDWLRIEPRVLDFYFCSRVVGQVGDRTEFSYHIDPLFEPRFQLFLRAYGAVYPFSENELLFVREAYRFFILNYVIRAGEHFFSSSIWPRLVEEAIRVHLPSIEQRDFTNLAAALDF